jgi:tRNA nucleotidyltransferase (CCA-adding enzyme)
MLLQHGWIGVQRAIFLATALGRIAVSKPIEAKFQTWWQEMPVKRLKELQINGRDLLKVLQKPAGPWLKEKLNELLQQVALGRLPNEREDLLKEGCKIDALHS